MRIKDSDHPTTAGVPRNTAVELDGLPWTILHLEIC